MNMAKGMKPWQRTAHGIATIVTAVCYSYASIMLIPALGNYIERHIYISSIFFLIGSLSMLTAFAVAAEFLRFHHIGR